MKFNDLSRDERIYLQGQSVAPEKFNRLCPDAQNQWKEEVKEKAYKDSFDHSKAVNRKVFFIK